MRSLTFLGRNPVCVWHGHRARCNVKAPSVETLHPCSSLPSMACHRWHIYVTCADTTMDLLGSICPQEGSRNQSINAHRSPTGAWSLHDFFACHDRFSHIPDSHCKDHAELLTYWFCVLEKPFWEPRLLDGRIQLFHNGRSMGPKLHRTVIHGRSFRSIGESAM